MDNRPPPERPQNGPPGSLGHPHRRTIPSEEIYDLNEAFFRTLLDPSAVQNWARAASRS